MTSAPPKPTSRLPGRHAQLPAVRPPAYPAAIRWLVTVRLGAPDEAISLPGGRDGFTAAGGSPPGPPLKSPASSLARLEPGSREEGSKFECRAGVSIHPSTTAAFVEWETTARCRSGQLVRRRREHPRQLVASLDQLARIPRRATGGGPQGARQRRVHADRGGSRQLRQREGPLIRFYGSCRSSADGLNMAQMVSPTVLPGCSIRAPSWVRIQVTPAASRNLRMTFILAGLVPAG